MGNISFWNRHNTKGNREHHEIVALHNQLLANNQAAWDAPREPIVWSENHRKERDRILLEFKEARLWGFKDPRTVLTYEGWQEAVPGLQFVGTFRHPTAVAASLKSRSKMAAEKSWMLWTFYNRRLLQEYRRHAFPVLCFDLPVPLLLERLNALFEKLELPHARNDEVFFDSELKHFEGNASAPLPDDVAALYEELRQIAF